MKGMKGLTTGQAVLVVIALIILAQSGFLEIGFLGAITPLTYDEMRNCYEARPQYQTITCLDITPDSINIGRGYSELGQIPLVNDCHTFAVELTDAVTMQTGVAGLWDTLSYNEIKDQWGGIICHADFWTPDHCDNKPLTYADTYTFCSNMPKTNLKISGRRPELYYQNPDTGDRWKIPGTQNCILQDWASKVESLSVSKGLNEIVTQEEEVSVVENPKAALRNAILPGDTFALHYAYVQKVPINALNYDGKAAVCDAYNFQLIGYKKIIGWDGQCYAVPTRDLTYLNKYDVTHFCCNDVMCQTYGLSSEWHCQDFNCVYQGVPTTPCWTDEECQVEIERYTTEANQDYRHTGQCKGVTASTPGTCDYVREEINCRPDRTYSGDRCCFFNEDPKGKLGPCKQALRQCPSGDCCLTTQNIYAPQECAEGLKCCEAHDDGIGYCAVDCHPEKAGIIERIGQMIKGMFGGVLEALGIDIDAIKDSLLGMLGLIVFIVIIFVLFKGSRNKGGG